MSLAHRLMPWVARLLTSPGLLDSRRRLHELQRRLRRQPHIATFYCRVDDPYSVLLLQWLPAFARHYGVQIQPRLMLYLDQQMYPEPEMLAQLGCRDAAALARFYGLDFPEHWQPPSHDRALLATQILLRHEQDPAFLSLATEVCKALWNGDDLSALANRHGRQPEDQTRMAMEARRDQFLRIGHYLTGTLHYAGEWYWGTDRLDHLARRLDALLPDRNPGNWPDPYGAAKSLRLTGNNPVVAGQTLELFFSFRSPYSWLALQRAYQLADHYGLELQVRPVLPMVMRGLSVPRAKRFYILSDAAREARLHGIPFGFVCDPVGPGVERCMALWPFAEKEGRLREFLLSAATGIWSQGINTASDNGLKQICAQAGLDWNRARRWLGDREWIERATANRDAMVSAGSWGVPSLRFGNTLFWGQDRLGLMETTIETTIEKTTDPHRSEDPS